MTEKIITDPDGATLKVMDYHGHLTQPFPGIGERLDALPELPIRDDDVVVVGYPKSGNHWVWELTNRILLNDTSDSFSKYLADSMIEARTSEILDTQPSPRVFMTHLLPHILSKAEKLFDGRHKIIYIIRNPKDVAVSFYTQTYNFRKLYGYDGSWSGYFKLFIDGTVDSGSWFNHVLTWEKYKAENPHIPIHFVFYEDLKQNLMGEMKRLGEFLGVPHETAFYERLHDVSVFSVMKKNNEAHAPEKTKRFYRNGVPTMYRKGIIGDWKNFFTVEQSDNMDAVFSERMKKSKLKIRFTGLAKL